MRVVLAEGDAQPSRNLTGGPSVLRGGAVQAVAVAATLLVVAAAGALLPPALSWIAGGMATVVGYLGVTAVEYALQAHAPRRAERTTT